jgi:RimJ/RimL family protein N-acetyltransferase
METVTLRLLTDSDADVLYAAVRESYDEVSPWMVWCRADYSLETAATWIRSTANGRETGTSYEFGVFDAHGAFAGVCGINHINTVDRFANLGYWCRTSLSHQGITPEAVRAVAAWTFANTDLNRLEIVVAVGNYRSQRVAEKVGAHREGVLRKRMMVGGLPSHAVMFSIVRPPETGEQPVVVDNGGALSEL